ncbi:hypothetical protein [Streptomyces sp. SYSU K217416]
MRVARSLGGLGLSAAEGDARVLTAALVAHRSDKLVSVTASGTEDGAEVVQWTDKGKI